MIALFWILPYPTRPQALLLYLPVLAARWIAGRRLWISTPLDLPLIALGVLAAVNPLIAPYTWGWEMSARVYMGIAIVHTLVDIAQTRRAVDRLLVATGALAFGAGLLALLTSQWTSKSAFLLALAESMPVWNGFPGATSGFNVNEIGGALAWFAPFAFALLIGEMIARRSRWRVIVYALACALLGVALALGQSRMAIAGVLIAMLGQALLLIPRPRWKAITSAGIVALMLLEIAFVITPADPGLSERDESSVTGRLDIWETGVRAALDHPLTGVGINKFRADDFRARYPVPGYPERNPPHAHNELLHVALDMGVPGLAAYVGLHIAFGLCLFGVWQRERDPRWRAAVLALAGAVIAHAIFGLADAITLADRWIWAFWWMIGLGAALYHHEARPNTTIPR